MAQVGISSGLLQTAGISSGAKGAMGGFTAALAATVILACICLGVYVQGRKSDDKKNDNVVLGTLAASVGVGSLTLISCFAYIGKQNKMKSQMQRGRLQQQVQRLRGGKMGQSFGQF